MSASGPAIEVTKRQVSEKKKAAKEAAKAAKVAIKMAKDAEKHVEHLTEFSTPYQMNCKPDPILAKAEQKADELEAAAEAAIKKAETMMAEAKAAQAAYRAANPGFFGKLFSGGGGSGAKSEPRPTTATGTATGVPGGRHGGKGRIAVGDLSRRISSRNQRSIGFIKD